MPRTRPLIGATTEVISHNVIIMLRITRIGTLNFRKHRSPRQTKDLNDEAKKWLLAETAKKLYNLS